MRISQIFQQICEGLGSLSKKTNIQQITQETKVGDYSKNDKFPSLGSINNKKRSILESTSRLRNKLLKKLGYTKLAQSNDNSEIKNSDGRISQQQPGTRDPEKEEITKSEPSAPTPPEASAKGQPSPAEDDDVPPPPVEEAVEEDDVPSVTSPQTEKGPEIPVSYKDVPPPPPVPNSGVEGVPPPPPPPAPVAFPASGTPPPGSSMPQDLLSAINQVKLKKVDEAPGKDAVTLASAIPSDPQEPVAPPPTTVPPPPTAPGVPPPPVASGSGSGMPQDLLSAIRQGAKKMEKSKQGATPQSLADKLLSQSPVELSPIEIGVFQKRSLGEDELIQGAINDARFLTYLRRKYSDEDLREMITTYEKEHPQQATSTPEQKKTNPPSGAPIPPPQSPPPTTPPTPAHDSSVGDVPPPEPGVPPPPPSPVQRSQSAPISGKIQGGLMEQIRAGKELRTVNDRATSEPLPGENKTENGSLADILRNSPMLKKFVNPESETNTDPGVEGNEEENDEWDDN